MSTDQPFGGLRMGAAGSYPNAAEAKRFFGSTMELVYAAFGSAASMRRPVERLELYAFIQMILTGVLVVLVLGMLCGTAWGVCKRRSKKRRQRYELPRHDKDAYAPFEV